MLRVLLTIICCMLFFHLIAVDYVNGTAIVEADEQSEKINNKSDINAYKPLYLNNCITKPLWVNQPLKGVNRCLTLAYSIVSSTFIYERTNTDGQILIILATPTAASMGALIGLIKSQYYNVFSKDKIPTFHEPKVFLEYGASLNNDIVYSSKIAYKLKFLSFDDLGIRYSGGNTYQHKNSVVNVHAELTDYKLDNQYLNFFYTLGLGISSGKFELNNNPDNANKVRSISILFNAGFKINMFDFSYIKFNATCQYAPLINKNDNFRSFYNESLKGYLSIDIGTDIF